MIGSSGTALLGFLFLFGIRQSFPSILATTVRTVGEVRRFNRVGLPLSSAVPSQRAGNAEFPPVNQRELVRCGWCGEWFVTFTKTVMMNAWMGMDSLEGPKGVV